MGATVAPGRRAAVHGGRPKGLLRLAGDDRLVALARAGDERAFEAIYDRHQRGLLAFCRHMLASREEAEDALQQTFMSAHRALADTAEPIALRAWLYAIARNRCISMLRARRDEVSAELAPEPSVEGLAAEVQRREDLRDLLRDVDDLPDDQRAALVLAELGDLGHDEIAQVIGVPRTKVKALVFQARASLLASRRARDMPCTEIRVQLANLRGGALRRTELRRHLNACAGCREYREEVRRQRAALALVLPVLPSAGLRESVLAAAVGGGGAAGGGGAIAGSVAGATALLKTTAAKVSIGLVAAGGVVTGGVVGVEEISAPPKAPASKAPRALAERPATVPRAAKRAVAAPAGGAVTTGGQQQASGRRTRTRSGRSTTRTSATQPSATVAPAPTTPERQNSAPKPEKTKAPKTKNPKAAKPKKVKSAKPEKVKKVKPAKPEKPVKPEKSSASAEGGTPAPAPTPSDESDSNNAQGENGNEQGNKNGKRKAK